MERQLKIRSSKIEDDIVIFNGGHTDVCPLNCIIRKNRLLKSDMDSIYKAKEGTNITEKEFTGDEDGLIYCLVYTLVNGDKKSRINITREEIEDILESEAIEKRGAIIFRMLDLEYLKEEATEEYNKAYKNLEKTDTTRLYSASEFASLINVSANTIRAWDNKDILKPIRVLQDGKRFYSYGQATKIIRETSVRPIKAIGYISNNDYSTLVISKIQELDCEDYEIIDEDIKYRERLRYVIDKIVRGDIRYLILHSEDMLVLGGEKEIIEIIGEFMGVEVVVV